MGPEARPQEPTTVPPIILLIDGDADTRDMYSLFLESSGMWVATAPDPAAAAATIVDLKPDLIVTDAGLGGEAPALEFAHAIKRQETTAHVPVVLLTTRRPRELPTTDHADADLWLVKPVLPDDLVTHITALLTRSRELRARNQAALTRAATLVEKSARLIAKARDLEERVNLTARGCPSCARPLQFVETGRIAGSEYDYYHWCDRGCGLYCYDRSGHRWVKLAG